MKFGKALKELRLQEWQEHYVDYRRLKKMVSVCGGMALHMAGGTAQGASRPYALSAPLPTTHICFIRGRPLPIFVSLEAAPCV